MPYFITDQSAGCDGWAVVKADGEAIGCHKTKSDAVDQMVAVSISEGIEPGGDFKAAKNSRRRARILALRTELLEERHPGHADQKTHNPHKGAGMGAVSALGSGSPDEIMALRQNGPDGELALDGMSNVANDYMLAGVYAERGYNAKPRVVGQDEFDATPGETTYRGVKKAEYADDLQSGELHRPGDNGWHGSGTYVASAANGGRESAGEYAAGGVVMEMKVDPKAKIVSKEQVMTEARAARALHQPAIDARRGAVTADLQAGKITADQATARLAEIKKVELSTDAFYGDPGLFAAWKGYDGIRVVPKNPGPPDYLVILNRGVLIVNQDGRTAVPGGGGQ